MIENLPPGFFSGGDNAYVNTEHMLVPFPGQNLDQRRDSYNFFLSQLRIRIENAFALLVARWGILWRPLRVKLKHQPNLIKCLFKLHNFCIDEKEAQPCMHGPGGDSLAPRMIVHPEFGGFVFENQSEWISRYQFQRHVSGGTLRDFIADNILEQNCVRPRNNLDRNVGRH
jgi:hypothetical protein